MDEPEEYIDFMAKYRDWVSIKRIGIRADTRPEEVVHYLAGVRATIDSRSYPMLAIKTQLLDQHAARVCAGMGKSFASLGQAISKLDAAEAKSAIAESAPKELAPLAKAYLLGKVITSMGFDTGISQQTMSKIFPGLKLTKAPGLGRGRNAKPEQE